jgi:aldehyde dehydrogenase (NAD+)
VPLMSVNMIKQSAQSVNLSLKPEVDTLLIELGVDPISFTGGTLMAKTLITGEIVAHVREVDAAGTTSAIERADAAFLKWRLKWAQAAQPHGSFAIVDKISVEAV